MFDSNLCKISKLGLAPWKFCIVNPCHILHSLRMSQKVYTVALGGQFINKNSLGKSKAHLVCHFNKIALTSMHAVL